MKYLFLILFIVGCDSVEKKPLQEVVTVNGYPVKRLFEYDGCKVYKFSDEGYFRYFTNCSSTEYQINYSCGGKGQMCRRPETIKNR